MATLQELQAQHPEWNVIQVIDAPHGGQYAVGADGGVFALGGAQYFGGYNALDPEQRQGERNIVGIKATRSGYTLLSDQPGQEYYFGPETQPAAPPAGGPPPAATTPPPGPAQPTTDEGRSAKALLVSTLEQYGLPASLADTMWEASLKMSTPEIANMIRGSKEYKARYPGMDTLRQKGRAISEAEYQQTESTIKGLMQFYGLPAGFYDSPDDFGKFIAGEVSPQEVEGRIQRAAAVAMTAPPELRKQLEDYGLSAGDLTAYFLDPPTAEEAITRRYLFEQGQIGVAGKQSGFGALTRDEAERLRQTGRSVDQLEAGLGQATAYQDLTRGTAEESGLGSAATRGDVLGSITDAAKQRELEKAARRRQAAFSGGGGAAGASRGETGLGGAS